jgi:hypothetical protein
MRPERSRIVMLRRSRLLVGAVVVIHVAAAVAVLAARIHPGLTVLLLGVVIVSLLRRRRLLECSGLVLRDDGDFEKVGAGDTALRPLPGSVRLGPLAVLHYRETGRSRHLVLLPDSFVTDDDRRAFNRWLTWQAGARDSLTAGDF